jgi:hypothetical protein
MNYLITIHRPHGYDPSTEDEAMHQAIDQLNDEMVAAGVRLFVGGLCPPESAKAIRLIPPAPLTIAPGLYLNAAEHVGGLWVLNCASDEEAIEWGKKAATACRAGVEVRPFH